MDKLYFIKIKKFCSLKGVLRELKNSHVCTMGKWQTLQQLVLAKLDSYMQENETGSLSNPKHKSKLEMDQRPECKSWSHKTLRRKHRQKSLEDKHEQLFHEHISLGKGNKNKNEQMGLHQTKKVLYSKGHYQ